MIIDQGKYPDIFVTNDDLNKKDIRLFEEMLAKPLQPLERIFFENMKTKEARDIQFRGL
jgi:hypothetical protein